jgi:hypothetical protein
MIRDCSDFKESAITKKLLGKKLKFLLRKTKLKRSVPRDG